MTRFRIGSALTLLIALMGAGTTLAQAAPQYTITDISPPNNKDFDLLQGINNAGHVARSTISGVTNLNDLDQLVGSAPFGKTDGYHASIETNGVVKDLGSLGGHQSYATAINNNGQVVGNSNTVMDSPFPYHGFFYSNGVMKDLGTLGGTTSSASGINDSGQIVGTSSLAGDIYNHAFSYANGIMTDLGTLPGTLGSLATAINNAGVIVGTSGHAVRWDHGVITDLGTLGGYVDYATGLNDQGDIVGYTNFAYPAVSHGFFVHDGVMTDLNTLIDPTVGLTIVRANDINNSGTILAATIPTSQASLFPLDSVLLTPNVTIVGAPGKPMGMKATAYDPNHIALMWNPVPGATGYWIYRSEAAGQFHRYCGSVGYITNFADSGLPQGKTYYYVVVAVNGTIAGPPSDEVSAKTPRLPGAASNLTATALESRLIQLTWSPAVDATSYFVFWRAAGTPDFTYIGTALTTNYRDDDHKGPRLSAGASYEYVVIPANQFGKGDRSNIATVTSPLLAPPPTHFTATASYPNVINYQWTAVPDASQYHVYAAGTPNGPFVLLSATSYTYGTEENVAPGTTRYYQVSSVDRFGEGAHSATISVTTPLYPDSPHHLVATAIHPTKVHLTWDYVRGATSYWIYRGSTLAGQHPYIGTSLNGNFDDTTAPPGVTSYYLVVSVNNQGGGANKSIVASATTPAYPEPPSGIRAAANSSTQVTLTWTPAGGSRYVQIYRGTLPQANHTYIATSTGSSYVDTHLSPGTTYYYILISYDALGGGRKSPVVGVTTPRP